MVFCNSNSKFYKYEKDRINYFMYRSNIIASCL